MVIGIIGGLIAGVSWLGSTIKDISKFAFDIVAMIFSFIYRVLNLTFSALPLPLKFLYGIGLMFIISTVLMNMTFGLQYICCDPSLKTGCEIGKVYETNMVTGITYKIATSLTDVSNLALQDPLTSDELDQVKLSASEWGQDVVEFGGNAMGVPVWEGERIGIEELFLFPNSFWTGFWTGENVRDEYSTCNIHTKPSQEPRIFDNTKINCWQDVGICKMHGDEDFDGWTDEGKCYMVVHSGVAVDPRYNNTLDFYSNNNLPCRPSYYLETGQRYAADPSVWQLVGSWIGIGKYNDELITTGSYAIPPTKGIHVIQFMNSMESKEFSDLLTDECGSGTLNEPDVNGAEDDGNGVWFPLPDGNSVFMWDTSIYTIEELEAWDEINNNGEMFAVPVDETYGQGLVPDLTVLTESGATKVAKTLGSADSIYVSSNIVNVPEEEALFSYQCDENNDLDVGIFGIFGIFTLQSFLVFAALWVIVAIIGFIYK